MQPPPLLPDHRLRRVLAISRVDGWGAVAVATVSGLVSLVQGGWFASAAALLVVLAGAAELQGRRRLIRGEIRGLSRMVAAQAVLLVIIWIYAWHRWRYFDPAALWAELPGFVQAKLDHDLLAAGLEPELDRPMLLGLLNTLTCAVLTLVSLAYQGGLALYYTRQREPVRQALAGRQPPAAR